MMSKKSFPTMLTENLLLRELRATDFDLEADFFSSERSHFVGGPLDRSETWRLFAAMIGHWTLLGYGFWGV